MIAGFDSKETEKIWNGYKSLKLPNDIQTVARKKLRMLNNARDLNDLRIPPNNRLEALKGNRQGFYSIRINSQWRICFRWEKGSVSNVEIVDYH
ncbi:type II toxin-antitoxin system RelE/ParE family toxin [Oceanispirochaeta sp.]|jgi:proteic killer suppression protein|uniref:type II toxin-antitoxin system RelE/ParE family toxin n=1 Tax=Oceanispirochaeta sp. TaxID=2035350 RepID=UPI00260E3ECC|nr:type II toxin-antitoxin system RelE/ParE family toxin [Oceanispirochaeta sp.]MDA3955775.1 type II toxin-antitoxin system RelE/ParE family toxin [Oceanispirochaeta sp.]